ncbi:MAG: hypothetical protein D6695_10075 [Planctomycetota bacterium]|nr:MAG: hypothetical protein D6695_10075 [Planctomycetota bacterium]
MINFDRNNARGKVNLAQITWLVVLGLVSAATHAVPLASSLWQPSTDPPVTRTAEEPTDQTASRLDPGLIREHFEQSPNLGAG